MADSQGIQVYSLISNPMIRRWISGARAISICACESFFTATLIPATAWRTTALSATLSEPAMTCSGCWELGSALMSARRIRDLSTIASSPLPRVGPYSSTPRARRKLRFTSRVPASERNCTDRGPALVANSREQHYRRADSGADRHWNRSHDSGNGVYERHSDGRQLRNSFSRDSGSSSERAVAGAPDPMQPMWVRSTPGS